jgi:hypothetical protein
MTDAELKNKFIAQVSASNDNLYAEALYSAAYDLSACSQVADFARRLSTFPSSETIMNNKAAD